MSTNGSSSEKKLKCESGCSVALICSTRVWYSVSARREASDAGIEPLEMAKRELPFVRSGSTQSEAVDAG